MDDDGDIFHVLFAPYIHDVGTPRRRRQNGVCLCERRCLCEGGVYGGVNFSESVHL